MNEPTAQRATPSLPLMNAAFVLAGLATTLLGPILPILIRQFHLTDAQAGMLLLAQFTGATLGGATVSQRLPRAFLLGLAAAAFGFCLFALAPNLLFACLGLLVGGFGVGSIIASVNIIAGARYTLHRGSALSRLNVAFSFGMLLSPLLAAWLAPRLRLSNLLTAFGALFFAVAVFLALDLRRPAASDEEVSQTAAAPILTGLFFLFAAILFFYGGLETCIAGWLTTYTFRYGTSSLVLSQYILVLLLCGLTAGRALATWLLLRLREATLLRVALALTILCAASLAGAHSAGQIAVEAVFLGACLAPVFPASFALYMARKPSARQAGLVLAASGLGAAAIPWLMGVVSTHARSLRVALTLPIAAALTLLLLSAFATAKPFREVR